MNMALKQSILFPGLITLIILPIVARHLEGTVNLATEKTAKNFVHDSNEEISEFLQLIKQGLFRPIGNVLEGVLLLITYRAMMGRMGEIAKEARRFSRAKIKDEQLKRDLSILSKPGLLSLESDDLDVYINIKLLINELITDKIICSYNNKNNCSLAYTPDIRERLELSLDADELQYYWQELRKKHGSIAKDKFNLFIQLFWNVSEISETTPENLWYLTYEDSNISTYMEDAMMQIKPFYTEFHAYVRWFLKTKYGKLILPPNGLIPHHLYEKILVDDSFIPQPYSGKSLTILKENLDEKNFDMRKLVELADDFFKSMGFQSLPESFWSTDCNENSRSGSEKYCVNELFDMTANVALKYCPEINFENYLLLHSDLARLHYANQKKNLPFTQFHSFRLELAVGKASIHAASTPKHQTRIGILQNVTLYEQNYMNQIFHMGLRTIFKVPAYFVQNKLMSEVLAGHVELEKINKRYWQLMEEYAGIEPPFPRDKSNFDFAPDFYEDVWENQLTSKFVNEILGYQLHRELCKISGEYILGSPNNYLQNCDYSTSTEAGEVLRRMMTLGGKQPWKEVLGEIIKDEPIINAEALLEFYEPLKHWLEAQNRRNDILVGWTNT